MSTTPHSPFNENPSSRPEAAGRSGEPVLSGVEGIPVFAPAHAQGSSTPGAPSSPRSGRVGSHSFQPWIILRKDLLHIWPEVLVSVCLLAAYAWVRILAKETAQLPNGFNPWALLGGIVAFLIPLSWMVLISRLVHDEELVGDRQFWITRPYTWYWLLLAKVLFVIAFIAVPFCCMQAWMLHRAALYPLLSLKPMLACLGTLAMISILPFFSIAAVTMTFMRYVLSVLAAFLYVLVVLGIAFWRFADKLQAPGLDWIITAFFILLPLAAIFIQYARRLTLIARLCLLATPLVFLLVGALTPASVLIDRHFNPAANLGSLRFDPNPVRQQPDGHVFFFANKATINIPVSFDLPGLPEDSFLEAAFLNVTLDGPNGVHYVSRWTAISERLAPGAASPDLVFRIPRSVFESLHGQPVHLQLEVAARTWKPGTSWTVTATEKPFALPDHANCILQPESGALECHHAYRYTGLTRVTATVHGGNCLQPTPLSLPAIGILSPDSGLFDPVAVSNVRLAASAFGQRLPAEICPGTPVTFTPYNEASTGQFHLDIPSIPLDPYATRLQMPVEAK